MTKKIICFLIIIVTISCSNFLSDEELEKRYNKALDSKSWETVIELLDEVIKRNPENKDNYYTRAIAKSNAIPKDTKGVVEDLTSYIDENPSSHKARYIRFQAYSMLKEYEKALVDIDKIIELKGKTSFLLSWKGNCAFTAKKFDIAEQCYEERLRLRGSFEDLKNNYYYWIASKYFGGNKEGALWDCAFLEDRGFKRDDALMKLLSEDKLVYEEIANFKIPQMTLEQLENLLNNFCSDLNLFDGNVFFRPELLNRFARVERTKDLKELLSKKEEIYSLNLSYNELSELPKELSQFINLQALNISGNRFKNKEKLIESLSKLPNLMILVANRCNLRKLPDNISLLKGLEVLSIETNGLKELNQNIGDLSKLKYLSVRSNSYLKDLPKSVENLNCLQFLNVSASGLIRLRDELSSCSELISIIANASKIETLPEHIGNLVNLKYLNLAANKIEVLPISIGQLSELENLSLGTNDIRKLPKEISNLQKLHFLSLSFNRFKEFPRETLVLDSVYNLWLHNNSFKVIPTEVGEMKSLTHLLIDHEIITDNNIEVIKEVNPKLRVIRNDSQRYVKGPKRKN